MHAFLVLYNTFYLISMAIVETFANTGENVFKFIP